MNKKWTETALNILYPRRCPVCHGILKKPETLVCPECIGKLTVIREPRCKQCGKPLEAGQEREEYCKDCEKGGHQYTEGRGIFLYDKVMKDSILRYKYGDRREYGDFYAKALVYYGSGYVRRWEPQAIVPVPLHKRKERLRGFNQAALIAKKAGLNWGLPVLETFVRKDEATSSQKKLDAGQRKKNLQKAFSVDPKRETPKKILIIDDVYTTGSTIDAISGILKKNGAKEIYFLTIAQGKGF